MFHQELNALQKRKQLIVLESDLHRSLIGLEIAALRQRFQTRAGGFQMGRPWVLAGSTAVGWMAIRHWRKLLRWAPAAIAAWRWFRRSR